uniref:Uncharacterized protein n=1 Tax=Plectus sambesii TaxID=2011161 RepID=A0A914VYD2_9BILA
MLLSCSLGTMKLNCCEIFQPTYVMNRGKCFSSSAIRQTDADEIGKLTVRIKQLPSIAMSVSGLQTQMMIYISNNSSVDVDEFSRYYIDMSVYNRMRFTASRVRFLHESSVCTNNVSLIGATCYVRQWYEHDVFKRFNCSFAYMHQEIPSDEYPVCPVGLITSNYYKNSIPYEDKCMLGCDRWNYEMQMMVYSGADRFKDFKFSLEASFTNLQYEDYEQIRTISIFGLIAQMGGQLGLFAGMSVLTITQIIVWYIYWSIRRLWKLVQANEVKSPTHSPPGVVIFQGVSKTDYRF